MRSLSTLFLAGLLAAATAQAAPTHHWRFEGGSTFLSDSIAGATLTPTNTPTQASIPGSGRGSAFGVVPGNASLADLDVGDSFATTTPTPTVDFTIEALVHLDTDPSLFGFGFAGFATGDVPSSVGWVLQTRQSSAFGPDNLVLSTGLGGSVTFFNSQIPLLPGKDYYVAAIFDSQVSGATATFWVRNLTDGDPAQSATVALDGSQFSGFNAIGTFVIGQDVHNTAGLDGAIDEVRLSDSALAPGELLVPVAPEVPVAGPWGIVALLLSLGAGGAVRARGRPGRGRPRGGLSARDPRPAAPAHPTRSGARR